MLAVLRPGREATLAAGLAPATMGDGEMFELLAQKVQKSGQERNVDSKQSDDERDGDDIVNAAIAEFRRGLKVALTEKGANQNKRKNSAGS